MIESTFDSCLLHIEFIHFEVINIQTDDTLILADDEFVTLEENELTRAHLTSKKREKLNLIISIKFNDELIILTNDDNDKSLLLTQSKQFDQIRLIDVKISIDLINSRDEVRKMITSKNQFIAQRAREAYIVIVLQLEASFNLSFAVQIINLKEEDAKRLIQRLQWQLNNLIQELRFVFLNRNQLRLIIFIDAAFANTIDLHSQIDYVICLTDDVHTNLIHWSSIKCKRVIRSVLAAELYAMINDFDVEAIIKSIIEQMLHIFLSLNLLTDSKSLFDCLIKLETTSEKRLMIDLMCLRQSYERREIAKIRWIDENINLADAMTKSKFCNALIKLIDINIIELKITEWIERTTKNLDDQNLWRSKSLTIKTFDDLMISIMIERLIHRQLSISIDKTH